MAYSLRRDSFSGHSEKNALPDLGTTLGPCSLGPLTDFVCVFGTHQPLRETLIKQTGPVEPDRRSFVGNVLQRAHRALPGRHWKPKVIH